jgi:site-specific recombinase XerD
MSFTDYLRNKGLAENSILSMNKGLKQFLTYVSNQDLHEIKTENILSFLAACRQAKNKETTIQGKLRVIRYYYDYLEISPNPAAIIQLRGRVRTLPSYLLEEKELDELYQSFPNESIREKTEKLILGLMVYQGLNSGEIKRLRLEDIKLDKASLYIPKRLKRNARYLDLKAFQILPFQIYLTELRPVILKQYSKKTDKIFSSFGIREDALNTLYDLKKRLKKHSLKFRDFKQIRNSVLVNWLKTKNLREVQYLAGHRYISSTERYLLGNIESLQEKIDEFHPLK